MKGQVQAGPTVGEGLTFTESKYRTVRGCFLAGGSPAWEPEAPVRSL